MTRGEGNYLRPVVKLEGTSKQYAKDKQADKIPRQLFRMCHAQAPGVTSMESMADAHPRFLFELLVAHL